MSRYSRYPFQPGAPAAAHATHQTVAATHLPPHHHHQHHHHQQHHQQHLRNPWVSGVECRESGSTNSSSASSRRGGGPWLHPLDLNHQPPTRHHHLYEQPLDVLGPSSALLPPGAHGHGHGLVPAPPPPPPQPAHAHAASAAPGSSRAASDRDRPTTPASSPGSAGLHGGSAALDGCGGHCVAFENFCYYCLQVVFVAGVVCGVSLTIAGSVLRQGPGSGSAAHRGRDLVVLVYIGCLLALVCAVLLAVQCCVRRNVKRRKRALRERRARTQSHAAAANAAAAQPPFTDLSGDAVPLQELPPAPAPAPAAISQYQPLLVRLVQQQQQQQQQQHHMQTLLPERHHQYRYRHSNMTVDPPLDTSRSGTPWWRRRSDFKQTVIESRH